MGLPLSVNLNFECDYFLSQKSDTIFNGRKIRILPEKKTDLIYLHKHTNRTLGYPLIVQLRFFFLTKFPLCMILIRYCTIIFSRPNFCYIRLFCTFRLVILNIFSEFYQKSEKKKNNAQSP